MKKAHQLTTIIRVKTRMCCIHVYRLVPQRSQKEKEEGQKEHHQGKLQISLPHLRRNYSESEKQCQKHGKKISGKNSDFRAYISVKGNTIKEKTLKLKDCSNCTFKCSLNVKDEQRLQIFRAFWSLENNERKKDFIVTNTIQKKTRTYIDEGNELVKKKRNVHRSYSFKLDGEQITVCKKFFLMTLGISESFAEHALQNQLGGVFVGKDKRGKHEPHNKTPKNALEMVRKHIESFPVVEGHYTRKDSNRKYLGADLNITRMYQLYLEHYKEELPEKEIVSQAVYRKVFSEEYNFSFHVPKQDQCALCVSYYQDKESYTLTPQVKEAFSKHQERKIKAREEKREDKEKAKNSKELFVATFDLQAVLQTPCSLVSQLYYMRKLSCYNLSIYNLANNNATCYLWSEIDAQRGSCEIATCLYLQLLSLPSSTKHVIFLF